MRTDTAPLMFTRKETGARLRVSLTTVNALIKSGELRSVKIGRARRIPADALSEYVDQLRDPA